MKLSKLLLIFCGTLICLPTLAHAGYRAYGTYYYSNPYRSANPYYPNYPGNPKYSTYNSAYPSLNYEYSNVGWTTGGDHPPGWKPQKWRGQNYYPGWRARRW